MSGPGEVHAEGRARLARALGPVIDDRGKQDLREWGGPSAGTVRAILDGTWTLSPQSRGTFVKIDRAADWQHGTAIALYRGQAKLVQELESQGRLSTIHEKVAESLLAESVGGTGQSRPVAGGDRGKGLMADERTEIGEVAKLLAEAAQRLAKIAEASGDERS